MELVSEQKESGLEMSEIEEQGIGLIERDINKLLHSKVGDMCILDYYNAYYGDKEQGIPHGVGILRMNDTFIIQSTWNHGTIDGKLIAFDYTKKRCVAFLDVKDGVIQEVFDVDKRDTIDIVQQRRYMYQGNSGIVEKESWHLPPEQRHPKPMSMTKPFSIPERCYGLQRNTNLSYLLLPDYTKDLESFNAYTEVFTVGQQSSTNQSSEIHFAHYHVLRDLHIKQNSCTMHTGLYAIKVPFFFRMVIGYNCFSDRKSTSNKQKVVRIESCPKLKYIAIDEACFYDFSSLQLIDLPALETLSIGARSFVKCKTVELSKLPELHSLIFQDKCFQYLNTFTCDDLPKLEEIQFKASSCQQLKVLSLSKLPALRQVKMEEKALYYTQEIQITNCSQLTSIVSSKENCMRCIILSIQNLPCLEKVMIGNESFNQCNCISIKNCEKLQLISIGNNSCMGGINQTPSELSYLPSLKWFSTGIDSLKGVEQILVDHIGNVPEKCIKIAKGSFSSLKMVDGNTENRLYTSLHSLLSMNVQ